MSARLAARAGNRPRESAPATPRRDAPSSRARWLRQAPTECLGLAIGERVFHQKFGYGRMSQIEGNKLMVDFDKAGQKKVIDSFVERV